MSLQIFFTAIKKKKQETMGHSDWKEKSRSISGRNLHLLSLKITRIPKHTAINAMVCSGASNSAS